MHRFKASLILPFILLLSYCKPEIPPTDNTTLKTYLQPSFNDVRKAINLEDGASVFVGMDGGVPTMLILNQDFSLRHYERFAEYGPGCFQNVCEMSNGDIAMVGYTQSSSYRSSASNPNAFLLKTDKNGNFKDTLIETFYTLNDQFTSISSLANEELLVSGFAPPNWDQRFLKLNKNLVPIDDNTIRPTNSYAYISDIIYDNGIYFIAGNYQFESNNLGVAIFTASTYLNNPQLKDTTKHYTYQRPSHWLNDGIYKLYRGEIIPSTTGVSYLYGTTGYVNGKFTIMLLDQYSSGDLVTEPKFINGSGQAVFQNMIKTSTGYLLLGSTIDVSQNFLSYTYDHYVVSINPDGNIIWEDIIKTSDKAESALTAYETKEGITVVGQSVKTRDNSSFYQVKYDINGNLIK